MMAAAAPAPPRQVTRVEVACLVHAYLAGEGFHRAAEAFRADAAELLAPTGATPAVRSLSDILSTFVALLDREQARSALAASNSFAARVLDALDACAGPAPPALQPLVVVPMPPPASRVPAPQQEQVPAAHAAPPGRSPGGARKPAAPRKRRAVGAAGAARSIRFAQGGPDSHAGMLPPGIASFQELLGSQLDASMLGDLINADDERLLALGQRVASALPPLDQWEAMGRGEHSGGLGGGSGAGGGLLGFGNEDSRFPLDDIISTFGADPTAQQILAPLVAHKAAGGGDGFSLDMGYADASMGGWRDVPRSTPPRRLPPTHAAAPQPPPPPPPPPPQALPPPPPQEASLPPPPPPSTILSPLASAGGSRSAFAAALAEAEAHADAAQQRHETTPAATAAAAAAAAPPSSAPAQLLPELPELPALPALPALPVGVDVSAFLSTLNY